uniref:Uncharacterized protein n=1 Tax=Romanomermis culicivorax TaxID=13658 RepID=A0A915KTE2_ROMCU
MMDWFLSALVNLASKSVCLCHQRNSLLNNLYTTNNSNNNNGGTPQLLHTNNNKSYNGKLVKEDVIAIGKSSSCHKVTYITDSIFEAIYFTLHTMTFRLEKVGVNYFCTESWFVTVERRLKTGRPNVIDAQKLRQPLCTDLSQMLNLERLKLKCASKYPCQKPQLLRFFIFVYELPIFNRKI